jgi:hypothetical protein
VIQGLMGTVEGLPVFILKFAIAPFRGREK